MRRLPEELKQFVRDHASGTANKDLAEMVNQRFGTQYGPGHIANIKSKLGVRSGIDSGFKPGHHSSPDTEFKPGHVPKNKGTKGMYPNAGGSGRFKPGHTPKNFQPIGTEVTDRDGYWKVKTAHPNIWNFKHRLIWEAENGPIPKGKAIIFLDGNRDNCTLENLRMVDRSVLCRMNQFGLHGDSRELGEAAVLTAEIITKIHKRKRERCSGSGTLPERKTQKRKRKQRNEQKDPDEN